MMNHPQKDSFGGPFVFLLVSVIIVTFVILGVDGIAAVWGMIF